MNQPQFNPAEGFQTILREMRARNYAPAVHPGSNLCVYDGPVGPCAVGLLLTPEMREAAKDSYCGVQDLVEGFRSIGRHFFGNLSPEEVQESRLMRLLVSLQAAHDRLSDPGLKFDGLDPQQWEVEMARVAVEYADLGLVYTPPEGQS